MNPDSGMDDIDLMYKPGRRGLRRVIDATRFSMSGLRAAWKNEESFRMECMLLLLMTPVAIWLATTLTQFLLLMVTCLLVLLAELLNSALEAVVDRIGTEDHPLSGQAKDLGSAAVFLCMMMVALVWGSLLWQRLITPCVTASCA